MDSNTKRFQNAVINSVIISLGLLALGCAKIEPRAKTVGQQDNLLPGTVPRMPTPLQMMPGQWPPVPTFRGSATNKTVFEGIWLGSCAEVDYDIALSEDARTHVASEQQVAIFSGDRYQGVFKYYEASNCNPSGTVNGQAGKIYDWQGPERIFEITGDSVTGNGAKQVDFYDDQKTLIAKDILLVQTDAGFGSVRLYYGKKTDEQQYPQDYYDGYPVVLEDGDFFTRLATSPY